MSPAALAHMAECDLIIFTEEAFDVLRDLLAVDEGAIRGAGGPRGGDMSAHERRGGRARGGALSSHAETPDAREVGAWPEVGAHDAVGARGERRVHRYVRLRPSAASPAPDHDERGPEERDIARRRTIRFKDPQGAPRRGSGCAAHRLRKGHEITPRGTARQRACAQGGGGIEVGGRMLTKRDQKNHPG